MGFGPAVGGRGNRRSNYYVRLFLPACQFGDSSLNKKPDSLPGFEIHLGNFIILES
jgi:hypothetical protein